MTLHELFEFYIALDIIVLSDVVSSTEETIMNKILKQVHPYEIYYSEYENRWSTYIKDDSQLSGRKRVVRKQKGALEKFLLEHYRLQLNMVKTYTFENLYVEFMQYKNATTSKSNVDAYIKSYKRFYKDDPIIHEDLSKIAVPTLRVWLETKIRQHKLNYKAYNKMAVVFNQLYKYAIQMEYIEKNPFDRIDVRSLGLYNTPKKNSKDKVFSKSETKDINKVAFDDFTDKPNCVPLAVLLTFQTGLRISEIVALKWEDVDLETKTLRVCRFERVQQDFTEDFETLTNCEHVIIECDTKGDFGERLVDLTDDALYILHMLEDYYKSEHLESEWLFVNKKGRIHNRAMDLRIRKYCRLTGIKEKSLHKVRSTYISMLRASGMSFEKIREEVGHKSILTTANHYLYDTEEDEENRRILNKGLNILTTA